MIRYSVVIPIYNAEKYLSECIDSVVSKNRKDVELILVNDGSTDNSLEICTSYKNKYLNIKIINKVNSGTADSWIKGVEIADGEYICFIDSDDYISKDYFEVLDKYVNKGYEMVMFDFIKQYVNKKNHPKVNAIKYGELSEIDLKVIKSRYYSNYDMCSLYRWNKVIKREIIIESINKITYRGVYFEDQTTLINLFLINKAIYIEDKLYYYRVRKNSVSHSTNNRYFIDCFNTEKLMSNICLEYGYKNEELKMLHIHFLYHYVRGGLKAKKHLRVKVKIRDFLTPCKSSQKLILVLYKFRLGWLYKCLLKIKNIKIKKDIINYYE